MKLLFDQNISFRILRLLPGSFAGCRQVRSVGLSNHSDMDIWRFAKQNNFTIVTFDADFFDIAMLKGFPPKIVWLRTGNLTTSDIAERLMRNLSIIDAFIRDADQSCLEIF
jgi:predicted nuclease of predicted toxin-antitoxin system